MAPKAKARAASPKPAPKPAASKAKATAAPKGSEAEKQEIAPSSDKPSDPPPKSEPEVTPDAAYDGKPLEVKVAEKLFTALTPDDMQKLASAKGAHQQRSARVLMAYVGDKDQSWGNTQASLKDAATFKKECLEMEGAEYTTRKTLEAMEAVANEKIAGVAGLQPLLIKEQKEVDAESIPAAFAIAVYMEAIIFAAREKMGMNEAPVVAEPQVGEEPPAWPTTIKFTEIPQALAEARKWKRTPLFLCSGKVQPVDTFFQYQSCSLIDAKYILNKVDIKKELTVEAIREEMRSRIISALKFGQPIHIAMSNSAVTIKSKYCEDGKLPEALFNNELWLQKEYYQKVVRESDKADWPGAFPGEMKDQESYSFVTSDFSLESATEYLASVLPYFKEMAIIQIDPDSIE